MKALTALALATALGGCTVTSETPLFKASDAATVQLAEGQWALHGPGCDVTPGEALPKCALAFTVHGDRIAPDVSGQAPIMGGLGQLAGPTKPDAPSEFLLVDGDPQVLQLRQLPPKDGEAGAAPPRPAGQRTYAAFRPTHQNAEGRSDRGVLWLIFCPDDPAKTPGFKTSGPQGGCEAVTREAVLAQAKSVPPIFSFFWTWVGPAQAKDHGKTK